MEMMGLITMWLLMSLYSIIVIIIDFDILIIREIVHHMPPLDFCLTSSVSASKNTLMVALRWLKALALFPFSSGFLAIHSSHWASMSSFLLL